MKQCNRNLTPEMIASGPLKEIVSRFKNVTITVIGDMIADNFVICEIARVSREAPVLILRHMSESIVPGGGANTVNNLCDLGVRALPVGIVGADWAGRELRRAFRQKRVDTSGIIVDDSYATVSKTRILAGIGHNARQQVLRVDREPATEPGKTAITKMKQRATQHLKNSDALLISDYGYGAAAPAVVKDVIGVKKIPKLPTVLDSRHRMLSFAGITSATPNESEVEEAVAKEIGGPHSLENAARKIMRRMRLDSLVITRGQDGMTAFEKARKPVQIPIYGSNEVSDVTGAGDTVIATYTAALAAGADTVSAAKLANYAAGIAVMKRGTATVTQQELIEAINKDELRVEAGRR